jgi:Rps23 Pro-64 3,4-dihydroxylase Tpa1-like proline 4-hydroxylase
MDFINELNFEKLQREFNEAEPFNHVIIDNFFKENIAEAIEREFPEYNDNMWALYDNAIEHKKTMNHWDRFKPNQYRAFNFLNSTFFVESVEKLTGIIGLHADIGLNGGGLHIHRKGGKLNVHLDYSLHPKLKLERRLNIIIYMSKIWDPAWGGGLQLWTHDAETHQPKECAKTIEIKFNRAVIFDTTKNSWHGLPDELECPEGQYRKSLAMYYLTEPRALTSERGKALFAPHKQQKNDRSVLDLIEKRSSLSTFDQVYRTKKTK